ncbi:MAG: preprotein translocase subunit SecG [Cyanobacteria bacterium]|nr:preprotein translocase subunit SecG [Cyanobacteriota bacterium]
MSTLYVVLIIFTALLALAITVLILLHSPKGEGMGGIGGSATVFTGKRGAEAGLDRVTWIFSLLFLFCCLVLGFGFVQ